MSLYFKLQNNKVTLAFIASAVIVMGILTLKSTHSNMDVIDILNRVGIIAPRWIVTAITAAGSVAAIITVLGTLGAGLPAAVLEHLAAASTAAA